MTTKLTGIVSRITVSGTVISGSELDGVEATVSISKERANFDPVGTDVSQIVTGMKRVEGSVRRAWVSGDSLFQDLLDNDNEFDVKVDSTSSDQSITASGCQAQTITRRVAPGTEVMMEEMPIIGRDWY